jgi:hypothetical protein
MDPNVHFSTQQSPSSLSQTARMNGVPYSEAIGSVLWPTVVSRPDTAYAVGVLSQFIQNPGPAHFGGNKKTLLEGYCDADWASQPHRHSISGFSFHYGQGAVSWSSKKQNVVALSSTEAEYIAETHAAKEAIIMGDNQGALALAKDNKFHARTKHIDLRPITLPTSSPRLWPNRSSSSLLGSSD